MIIVIIDQQGVEELKEKGCPVLGTSTNPGCGVLKTSSNLPLLQFHIFIAQVQRILISQKEMVQSVNSLKTLSVLLLKFLA